MNKLKKEKDKYCGRNEWIVHCKFCNVRHYQNENELFVFKETGYYICISCIIRLANEELKRLNK